MKGTKVKNRGGVFYVLITGVLWILFGIVCIILDEKGFVVFGKLAREISKFFGYLICFRYGRYAIRCKDTAWKIDFHFFCAAACFVVIQVTAALIDVGANTTLLRMMCGLAGSRVIVSLFYYFRKQVTWLENLVSKYSVEIYMLHGNIVHKLILVPVLSVLNFRETEMMIVFCLISLVADFGLSLGIAFMERFFVPINFIFHPMGYLEKRD